MDLLNGLALVLLTLVGYSSGAVIAGRSRPVRPELVDLGMVVVLWAMALGTRSMLGKWTAILIWAIAAGLVSALFTALRRKGYGSKKERSSVPVEDGRLRWVWKPWKAFTTKMGNYQGRVLLAFFYFIVVTPFGIGVRLFSDPLAMKRDQRVPSSLERRPISGRLEAARSQF